MRLVLWNCKNGISGPDKVDFILKYDADIYVLPEVKLNNFTSIKKKDQSFGDPIWVTNNFSPGQQKKRLGCNSQKKL